MSMMRIETKILVLVFIFLLVLGFISLRYIPTFNIDTVLLDITNEGMQPPHSLTTSLAQLTGISLFSLNLYQLERKLSALSVVEDVQMSRQLPSSLKVTVSLVESPVLVSANDQDGQVVSMYLLRKNALVVLDQEDWNLYAPHAVKVEIPQGYASMMQKYGIDSSFVQVMELAGSLDERTTLITRIKYDNNSSNSFGKMVLELSSLNAQIWVREPVSTAQVTSAVALVEEDQKEHLSFLSSDMKRYDLYRGAMVRR
ncbi:MAG: FtsQ-type POTRA domain-containing protein [Sphaerochaeta sp.]|nr:FtsQ-type POTRA domain-containing protein [Sphaerochaeta sp.]